MDGTYSKQEVSYIIIFFLKSKSGHIILRHVTLEEGGGRGGAIEVNYY
jgi:hypothetical protein